MISHFSPDDLVIVQRRQDWRLRIARICVEYFENCDEASLESPRRTSQEIRDLLARFARISDYIRRDLPILLMTGVTVHDLEAVRHQVNYFLEEMVRHLRTKIQSRRKTKQPLLGLTQEDLEEEVFASLSESPDSLLVFIEDVVKLTQFEIEVGSQRERIRLLLGGDRRLSNLGNNEAIMTAPRKELWRALDDFVAVYSYLREHLPPLLDKASPYPALEEELEQANDQLQALIRERVDPFGSRLDQKKAQDRALRDLEQRLEEGWRRTTEILEIRVGPLLRQASSPREGLITSSELDKLHTVVRELVEELGQLPLEVELPATATEADRRIDLAPGDLALLEKQLEDVLVEVSLLPQTALLGRGASAGLPASGRLEEMLVTAEERLGAVQKALESPLAEIQRLRGANVTTLREHFCTLTGELRTFLQTSFAHIASKDPRSTESSYHFFLREFANEARQAILLLKEIRDLEDFIHGLSRFNIAGLPLTPENLARILRVLFADKEEEKKRIPSGEGWRVMEAFVEKLKNDLVPRLQKVCALDGIRYEDQHFLTDWAMELTRNCTLCLAQHEIGYNLLQEMGRLRVSPDHAATTQTYAHIVTARTCKGMQESLTEICMSLTASIPYVGIMKGGIERRASVFFHRQQRVLEGSFDEAMADAG